MLLVVGGVYSFDLNYFDGIMKLPNESSSILGLDLQASSDIMNKLFLNATDSIYKCLSFETMLSCNVRDGNDWMKRLFSTFKNKTVVLYDERSETSNKIKYLNKTLSTLGVDLSQDGKQSEVIYVNMTIPKYLHQQDSRVVINMELIRKFLKDHYGIVEFPAVIINGLHVEIIHLENLAKTAKNAIGPYKKRSMINGIRVTSDYDVLRAYLVSLNPRHAIINPLINSKDLNKIKGNDAAMSLGSKGKKRLVIIGSWGNLYMYQIYSKIMALNPEDDYVLFVDIDYEKLYDFMYTNSPIEVRKQQLLEDITSLYNLGLSKSGPFVFVDGQFCPLNGQELLMLYDFTKNKTLSTGENKIKSIGSLKHPKTIKDLQDELIKEEQKRNEMLIKMAQIEELHNKNLMELEAAKEKAAVASSEEQDQANDSVLAAVDKQSLSLRKMKIAKKKLKRINQRIKELQSQCNKLYEKENKKESEDVQDTEESIKYVQNVEKSTIFITAPDSKIPLVEITTEMTRIQRSVLLENFISTLKEQAKATSELEKIIESSSQLNMSEFFNFFSDTGGIGS